ncbi:MAG: 2,3-bisphosphoglycerate-independent phosphoglycerate mutase [Thermoplasmataceae archaeon]
MKNIMLIVLDGLGDRPNQILSGKTALQAAFHPTLNGLIRDGQGGLMTPIAPGIRAGSDTSHLSLLGYDPERFYSGRGPFEAMGLGLEVRPGDVAFRANFGTTDSKGIVIDRRAGRLAEGNSLLAKSLNMEIDGVRFFVKEGVEHRAALVMRGDGLSDKITDSDPHETGRPINRVMPVSPEGKFTADVLNRYLEASREVLRNHEANESRRKNGKPVANELLLRGPGKAPELRDFREMHGMSGAVVAGIPMITGIGGLLGMHTLKPHGSTGTLDSDFTAKLLAASDLTKKYDYVLVNIKATDVAGHDGDAIAKKDAIERIDRAVGEMMNTVDRDLVIAVTGDHATPCSVRDHSGDPVPVLFRSEGILSDRSRFFDELSASAGMWRISSIDVMNILKEMADRSEKYGA